ncbi:hypothetical protein F5Y07DRAFT_207204 [Xylaria sp. FL0933]|nr:hypothetical protein F5Y07DRAFT_207204 [Xylaria sp. FL0933]
MQLDTYCRLLLLVGSVQLEYWYSDRSYLCAHPGLSTVPAPTHGLLDRCIKRTCIFICTRRAVVLLSTYLTAPYSPRLQVLRYTSSRGSFTLESSGTRYSNDNDTRAARKSPAPCSLRLLCLFFLLVYLSVSLSVYQSVSQSVSCLSCLVCPACWLAGCNPSSNG